MAHDCEKNHLLAPTQKSLIDWNKYIFWAVDVKDPLAFDLFELRSLNTHQENSGMRDAPTALATMIDFYADNALGDELRVLSDLLND